MTPETKIEHVSDTALWVAVYRSKESERPDALFKDPLATLLTGERGKEISRSMPYGWVMSWVMVVRTVAIDRLILKALDAGVDTVVNLGAGLDTRPYRMTLPSTLRWIEVDFPHMIEMKNEKLKNEKAVCRLERISADLSDRAVSRRVYADIGRTAKKVLVITEGVIPYLSNEDANRLAEDLRAVPSFQYWIQDYRNGGYAATLPRGIRKRLKGAPMKFKVGDWLEHFSKLGWATEENILSVEEGNRIGRPMIVPFPWNLLFLLMPKRKRNALHKAAGYALLKKISD